MLGLDPTVDARALRRQVGLLGHPNGLYDDLTAEENVRFAARAARLPKAAVTGRPWTASASGTGSLALPAGEAVGRASAGEWRWPPCWPADRCCGCSTNRTPASTPNTVSCWTGSLKEVTAPGQPSSLASHEIRTSEVLADRVVTMSGGTVLDGVMADPRRHGPADGPALDGSQCADAATACQPDLEQPSVA